MEVFRPRSDSLWRVGHAERRQVSVAEGEQDHDGDKGAVVAEDDGEPGVLHVAQHDQRDVDHAGHHGHGEQDAVPRRLRKHQQSCSGSSSLKKEKALRTHPLEQRRGAAASQVHGVEHDEAANTGEHFVCEKSRRKPPFMFRVRPNHLGCPLVADSGSHKNLLIQYCHCFICPEQNFDLWRAKRQTLVNTAAATRVQNRAARCLTPAGGVLVDGLHSDRDDGKHRQGDGEHTGHTRSHEPDLQEESTLLSCLARNPGNLKKPSTRPCHKRALLTTYCTRKYRVKPDY